VYTDSVSKGLQLDGPPKGIRTKPSFSEQTQKNIHQSNASNFGQDKAQKSFACKEERRPTCWTVCTKCPPINNKSYHLIDINLSSKEAEFVCEPLTKVSFYVIKVQRIQNDLLWERLMAEKKLMLRSRDFVNMQFLYHTTSAKASVICEEGLDLRLSRQGNFGNGIYLRYMI